MCLKNRFTNLNKISGLPSSGESQKLILCVWISRLRVPLQLKVEPLNKGRNKERKACDSLLKK